jgi:signal transduction histidine kinase
MSEQQPPETADSQPHLRSGRRNDSQRRDIWERLGWIWNLLFYVFILIPIVLYYPDPNNSAADQRNILLLSGLLAGWHLTGAILLPRRFPKLRGHPLAMSIVMAGIVIIWFILVQIHPGFNFTLGGLFSQVFTLLPPNIAIPGSIIITAVVAYAQITENGVPFSLNNPILLIYGLMGGIAILIAFWINAIIGQSVQRRNLIEQLEQSQSELAAAERRAGTLAERQRLAHEIHDTLAQGFISIIMHLEAADQALPADTETAQTHLDNARTTARDGLKQARRVVDNLRPQSLEGHSLPEAIERTAVNWSGKTGIAVQTTVTGDTLALHPDVEVTLLRAAQEALNNVRKHAGASSVDITLSYMGDVVILDVQDNGLGMNGEKGMDSAEEGGGYGLVAMRQRVAQFSGTVTLESDPGEGTTVVVEIPIGGE